MPCADRQATRRERGSPYDDRMQVHVTPPVRLRLLTNPPAALVANVVFDEQRFELEQRRIVKKMRGTYCS